MSEFSEHIRHGYIAHALGTVGILPVLALFEVPTALVVGLIGIALPATLFASIIPDIDHPSSHAYRLFNFLLFSAVVILVAGLLAQNILTIGLFWLSVTTSVPFTVVLGTIAVVALGIAGGIVYGFTVIRPPHRGPTHSLLFGFIASVLIGGFAWQLQTLTISGSYALASAGLIAFYSFLGFCSHLNADGLLFQPLSKYTRLPNTVRRFTQKLQ